MNDHNLKLFGSGAFTEEEEKQIRSKGGTECAQRKKERRTAQQLLQLVLSSEVKDPAILKQLKQFSLDGKTVDLALLASAVKNTMRKGTISDALEAFTAAGMTESATDEAAHKSFLAALTADDDEPGTN